MNFFIAVVFLCVSETECVFWHADKNYYSQEQCKAAAQEAAEELKKINGDKPLFSACLRIKDHRI